MTSNFGEMDLRKLLEFCVDRTDPKYESAWREFDRRFRKTILGTILTVTNDKHNVEDISQSVMERLFRNDFRALRNFREPDQEPRFRKWLSIIARRLAIASVSNGQEVFLDENFPIQDEPQKEDFKELHKKMVLKFRKVLSQTQKPGKTIERDIFIYALRNLFDFRAKEVAKISALEINEGNVDNVVNRLKPSLKK